MTNSIQTALALAAATLLANVPVAEARIVPERNPFSRSDKSSPLAPSAGSAAAKSEDASTRPSIVRAIISGGQRPLVIINGTIAGIGEVVEGYRLVEVREREAVFERDGSRVTLSVDRQKTP